MHAPKPVMVDDTDLAATIDKLEGGNYGEYGSLVDAASQWRGSLNTVDGTHEAASLCAQAVLFAHTLKQLGIGPGAVVIIATGSNLAFFPALLGASLIGACPLPMAPVTAPAVLEAIVKLTNAASMLVPTARAALIAAVIDGQSCAGKVADGYTLIMRSGAANQCQVLAGTIAIASSGTTGLPKIVIHQPQSLLANARRHAAAVGLDAADRFLLALPCHFSFGLVAGMLAPILAGADIVLADQPISTASWLAVVNRQSISVFSATPSLIRRLVAAGPFPRCLHTVTIGGDEVLPDDMQGLREVFDGTIHLTYGLSEAGPRVFTQSFAPHQAVDAAALELHVGQALPGIEHKLLQAAPHEDGEIGELALLTPTAMLGRWNGSHLLRDDFDGPWLKTGDIFCRNARDELKFVSRKKELIVVGGEKIGVALIRRVLLEHPAIVAARVWPEPHAELGAIPVASVRFADGAARLSDLELIRWSASRLRRIELPRRIDEDPTLPISFK